MTQKTQKKKVLPTELKESAHQIWLAGLGALAVAEEEGSKLFKNLVKKGEGFEKRGKKQYEKVSKTVEGQFDAVRDQAEDAWGKLGSSFDERVAGTLQRLGVPSRLEIQKLTKRVEQLTKKVDQAKAKPKSKAKSKTTTSRRTTRAAKKSA